MHIPYRGEIKILDDESRKFASGKFIELSAGVTHYQLSGPKNAKSVILFHGIAGPTEIWKLIKLALVKQGYQVLQYDYFGKGYSDRVVAKYDLNFFINQIEELIDKLKIPLPVNLIGWSLGGLIATQYASKHIKEIEKLILISPVGIDVTFSIVARIVKTPILGEFILLLLGRQVMLHSLKDGLLKKEHEQEFLLVETNQMQYRGYIRGFLSTLRYCVSKNASSSYTAIGKHDLPAMVIFGPRDAFIPVSAMKKIKEFIPSIKINEISGAGHIPHYEQPTEVNPLILEFLKD